MTLQQLTGCGDNFADSNFQQPLVGRAAPGVIGPAACVSQHNRLRREWAVARRICRTKNCHDRNSQSGRQMHGPGIAADEQAAAAGEGDEFGN